MRLKVSQQRVRALLRDGVLFGRQLERVWMVDPSSVETHATATGVLSRSTRTTTSTRDGLNLLSFFSGAMGLDQGLENQGITTRFACEIDRWARETIAMNKYGLPVVGDIWKHDARDVLEIAGLDTEQIDVIAGGPPCQAFSTAGTRRGLSDHRGNVFLRFIDMICEIQPRYAVIENVRGLLSMAVAEGSMHRGETISARYTCRGGVIAYVVDVLRDAGYAVSFNLYNAANFGSAQKRERVVILCSRDRGRIPFLEPSHAKHGAFGLQPWRTFRDAVNGLNEESAEHLDFPEARLKYYRMLGPGQYWKDLPPDVAKEAMGRSYFSGGGKTGFFRRLAWDDPAPTVVTHPAMPATDLAHPELNRPLSIQEYRRLQDFKDEWQVAGPLREQYRQLGNAVPVRLGEAIGRAIVRHDRGDTWEEIAGFPYSRYRGTSDLEIDEVGHRMTSR